MPRGVNKAIVLGYLGQDPEVRYTANGKAIATVSVATSERWTDKRSGEQNERTEWHRIVFFGRLAEVAGEYLKKGSQIYVEGSIRTRKWQDQSGQDRYTTEIVGAELQMLGESKGGGSNAPAGKSRRSSTSRHGGKTGGTSGDTGGSTGEHDELDDDIPFATSSASWDMTLPRRGKKRPHFGGY